MAELFYKQTSILFGLVLNYVVAKAVLTTFSTSDFETQIASVGSNVRFSECTMDNTSLVTIVQYSPRLGLAKMPRIGRYRDGRFTSNIQSYKGRILIHNTSGFVLKNVGMKDSGFYKCQVELNNDTQGNGIERRIQLKIGVAPTIQPLLDMEILEELSLKLVCNIHGLPTPAVEWFYSSLGLFSSIGTNRTLELNSIKVSQSGLYYCSGKNYMGEAKESMEVKVYKKPRVREFFHDGSLDGVVWQCQNVSLRCEVFANPALSIKTYSLYQNDILMNKNDSGIFVISSIGMKHSGTYSCVPETRLGSGRIKTLLLHVKAAPKLCKEISIQKSNSSRQTSSTVEPLHFTQLEESARNHSTDGKSLHPFFVLILSLFFASRIV